MELRKDQWLLLAAAVITVVLWMIPSFRLISLPLLYFNTHLHELGHVLAAFGTGGSADSIQVFGSGSGVAMIRGGNTFIVSSAGYVGTTVMGAALLLSGGSALAAKRALLVFGCLMTLSMVFFVRGDLIGVVTGVFWTLTLFGLGKFLQKEAAIFAAQFLGLQLALASFEALSDLFFFATKTQAMTDAKLMESATGIPDVFWASLWAVISVVCVVFSLKMSWKGVKNGKPA